MAKRGFNGAVMRLYGAHDHIATVTGTEYLAPHFLRVHLHSDTLLDGGVAAPAAFVRLWFPDPDGGDIEYQRGYTFAQADEATGSFAIDFVLHEPAGPASHWAKNARPGTTISAMILGSTRFDLPDELPDGYLIIGDPASLPAINSILAVIPPHIPIELYLEQHDDNDRLIAMTHHPRTVIHWVERKSESSLAEAIEDRNWSNWYAWVATESGSLKHLRKKIRDEFGFPRSEIHAQAYWYYGRAFGKSRDKNQIEESDAPQRTEPEPRGTDTNNDEPSRASQVAKPAKSATAARTQHTGGRWKSQAGRRLVAPLKKKLVIAGLAQAVISVLELVPYVLLVEFARRLLTGSPHQELVAIGVWALALMGAGVLATSALMLWLHWVDASFANNLRVRLIQKLSALPLGWFSQRSSGQVKQIIQDDTLSLHYLVTHAVVDAVAAALSPILVLIYLFAVDWRIALVLIVPVLAYVVVMAIMVVQSQTKMPQAMAWTERMNVEAAAYIEGQPVIRVFGGATAAQFSSRLDEYLSFLRGWQQPLIGYRTFIDLVTRPATFLLLIAAMGTIFITSGRMEPIDLLPFLFLGTSFGTRLLSLGYGIGGLREGTLAARRIQVTLDEPELVTISAPKSSESNAIGSLTDSSVTPGVIDSQNKTGDTFEQSVSKMPNAPLATTKVEAKGKKLNALVEFHDVTFGYQPHNPVVHNVTMGLKPGTVTALVGPSGSGKSTLAALLARFYDVQHGAITINGTDLTMMPADELYQYVGFVFQHPEIINATVHDNIALARPHVSRGEVEQAAKAAQLHDRIMAMPHGYDTHLDARAALSGGEKQRLTIARALIADTAIIVLDEATAYADPESEYLVQQALATLLQGRTVLVIAHRLPTVIDADQIIVLSNGRIVQQGTHPQLVKEPGQYQDLWQSQHLSYANRAIDEHTAASKTAANHSTGEQR